MRENYFCNTSTDEQRTRLIWYASREIGVDYSAPLLQAQTRQHRNTPTNKKTKKSPNYVLYTRQSIAPQNSRANTCPDLPSTTIAFGTISAELPLTQRATSSCLRKYDKSKSAPTEWEKSNKNGHKPNKNTTAVGELLPTGRESKEDAPRHYC